MKILISLLLVFVILFSFTACSDGGTPADGTDPSDTTAADTTSPVTEEKWPEVEGTVIYVDVAAEDGGDGTEEAPFKSIPQAQAKIREIKSGEGLPEGGITVLLASGNYPLMDAITFTAEDSGTEECPITYMSAKKNGAVLNGGITIDPSDFTPLDEDEKAIINDEAAKDKILKLDLSRYGITSDDLGSMDTLGNAYETGPAEIFVNDERLYLSQYPNKDVSDPYLRTGTTDGVTNFDIFAMSEFEEQAVAIKERGKNWDIDNLWTSGYFMFEWAHTTVPVAEMDIDSLNVTLAKEQYYGIGVLKKFYFFNIFAETDMPGEYYIDRDNMVLYVYPPENFDNSSIVISLSEQNIISAENLSYVNFSGLKFTATRAYGIILSQDGDHVTIENCEFSNIGMDAVYVLGNNITVQNNQIHQIGGNAIAVYGGDVATLSSSNNLVYNNYIYDWAQVIRTYKCAVYLNGCGITVSHNEMHDAPHEAIEYVGPNNTIEYNKIYNVCMETGDCGAIYSKRSFDMYGTVLRYNLIYDVGGKNSWALGIYWDDGLAGQTAYGNVVANVTAHGMNVGGGRDNVVENNIFINWASRDHALHYDNRARDYADDIGGGQEEQTVNMANRLADLQKQQEWLDAFPGYGDIIPYTYDYAGDRDDPMLSCNPANAVVKNNIACRTDPTKYDSSYFTSLFDVEKMLGTYENNFEIQDPDHTFIPGYENGDFTIAEDSEVYSNGFVRIPVEEIGRVTND